MRPFTLGVAAVAGLVNAQVLPTITISPFLTSTTSSSTNTGTPAVASATGTASAAAAQTHTIAVGASGFAFSPAKTEANVGDTIEWIFYPDAHSVIRAEFGFPCTPYEYIDIGREGFYSGNQSVKAITNGMPRYRVRVNDTLPIFYYCGAPGSCYKEKMIGVINENSTQTLDKQLEAALPLTTQILPGEPFPTESDAPKATSGGSNNGAVIDNYHHSVSGGQIAGIVIGSLAFILLGGLLVYLCGRRGGINRAYKRTHTAYQAHPPPPSQPAVTELNYSMQPKSPSTQGWRSSHYSNFSGPYRDHATPTAQFSPQLSPQPTGFSHPANGLQTYYDHRISSIAPSVVVEAPDNQATTPAATQAAPAAAPVELPTATDSGNSPPPKYMPRFSFAGQESEYRPSTKE
ncbi:extracellular serine-rich protein [Colletotrichum fioriniae PJ7]|uniref:Extracellular serine-rich protein n=1 Tax=Colletotrichum fioriniae PJ7 TaxID=1445577 RepID=A0A010RQ01_9PEZI|nr:extracellular serine-rich protein [Colletotrichum fioriniae PJ7]